MMVSTKLNIYYPMTQNSRYIPPRITDVCLPKNTYRNVNSSTTCNSSKLETTQTPIHSRMNFVAYLYHAAFYTAIKMNKPKPNTMWITLTNVILSKLQKDTLYVSTLVN